MSRKILTERTNNQTLELITEGLDTSKNPNILGRLRGIGAKADEPTRNGRTYTRPLWEKVLQSDTFKEYLETRTLYGELNHPEDRLETDIREIAISLTDAKLNDKGELITTFDILNTPNGRILKTLCDYGSKLGVSSRGGGETYYEGDLEFVNEDSYEFVAFDVVTLPAVKQARPDVVESKKIQPIRDKILEEVENEKTVLGLKSIKRLVESLDMVNEKEIIETIEKKIDSTETVLDKEWIATKIEEAKTIEEATLLYDLLNSSKSDDFNNLKESAKEKINTFENMEGEDTTSTLLEDLKDALNAVSSLEEKVANLQKEISAGTTRENELMAMLEKARQATKALGEKAKKASSNKQLLEEVRSQNKERVELLTEQKRETERKLSSLRERFIKANTELNRFKKLSESLDTKYTSLLEQTEKITNQYKDKISSMVKDHKILENKLIDKSNKLVEAYKSKTRDLKRLAENYIKSYAKFNSLDAQEMINRLPENFTSRDVDNLLERGMDYKHRIKSLPFNIDDEIEARIVSEQSEITTKPKINNPEDDDLTGVLSLLENITTGYSK